MDLENVEVSPTLQKQDKVYGYEIVGEKGSVFITYRTSSNGYYRGRLDYVGEFYGDKSLLFQVDKHFISRYV